MDGTAVSMMSVVFWAVQWVVSFCIGMLCLLLGIGLSVWCVFLICAYVDYFVGCLVLFGWVDQCGGVCIRCMFVR